MDDITDFSKYPDIKPSDVNTKMLRKSIKKTYASLGTQCRFDLRKETSIRYREKIKDLTSHLFKLFDNPLVYENKCFYYLMALVESNFYFMTHMSKRLFQCETDMYLLDTSQELIIQKLEQLSLIFKLNVENPVSFEDVLKGMQEAVVNGYSNDETTGISGIGSPEDAVEDKPIQQE